MARLLSPDNEREQELAFPLSFREMIEVDCRAEER